MSANSEGPDQTAWTANGVDPNPTPRCAVSDLGLNCLLWLVCPNT